MLRRYNKKSADKRKEERAAYPEFYKKHINKIKTENLFCEECGHKLIGDVSEVCHILPKSSFKSVAVLDENIIYMCGWKAGNNCHGFFDDSPAEKIREMKIFSTVCERFELIEREAEEKINYKIYDRYSCQH